jgi:hypothetical protein
MTRSSDPTRSFPPPTDAAARYDAVVRRGRSLRRRQRLARGAGAGGAALVVLLVAVLVIGRAGGSDNENQVVTNPTSSTTSVPPSTKMTVTATFTAPSVDVTVDDPNLPQTPEAHQCVYVRLAPIGDSQAALTEARSCWTPATDGPVDTTEPFSPLGGPEIGCGGATLTNPGPDETTTTTTAPPTAPVSHTFHVTLPTGLTRGSYSVEASGVSGVGDGCETVGSDDTESFDKKTITIEVP